MKWLPLLVIAVVVGAVVGGVALLDNKLTASVPGKVAVKQMHMWHGGPTVHEYIMALEARIQQLENERSEAR